MDHPHIAHFSPSAFLDDAGWESGLHGRSPHSNAPLTAEKDLSVFQLFKPSDLTAAWPRARVIAHTGERDECWLLGDPGFVPPPLRPSRPPEDQ